MNTVLVERYATLGGVCLNVGCIPSKALLHNAAVIDEAKALAAHGILFGEAEDRPGQACATTRTAVVGKLTGGLAGMAKARKVQVVRGIGTFLDPHHLEVQETEGDAKATTGKKTVIRFEKAIIAAGSQAVKLPFVPEDPRIVDSTGALELPDIPKQDAGDRRRHHRAGNGHGVQHARRAHRRGGNARRPDAGRGPRPGQGLGQDEQAALRQRDAEDQDGGRGSQAGWHLREVRGRGRAGRAAALRPGAGVGRPRAEWQEDRRRKGWCDGDRPRLYRGRQPTAHERAAYLRHRRHRRPADAGPQGGA